ncbi:hypothetical protein BOFL111202_18245 [Bordetella flabilis]
MAVVAGHASGFLSRPAGQPPAGAVPVGRCGAWAPQTASLASSGGRSLVVCLRMGCRHASLRRPLARPLRAVPGRRLPRRTPASSIDGRRRDLGSCRCDRQRWGWKSLQCPPPHGPQRAARLRTRCGLATGYDLVGAGASDGWGCRFDGKWGLMEDLGVPANRGPRGPRICLRVWACDGNGADRMWPPTLGSSHGPGLNCPMARA